MLTPNQQGLTLIELLVVGSLLALLLGMALPFGYSLYQKNQLQLIITKVKNAIAYGRTMAIAQGSTLALAPLDNSNWASGLVLFIDNPTHSPSKATILQVWQWRLSPLALTWHGLQSKQFIIFSPSLRHMLCNGHFSFRLHGQEQEQLIVNQWCLSHLKSALP